MWRNTWKQRRSIFSGLFLTKEKSCSQGQGRGASACVRLGETEHVVLDLPAGRSSVSTWKVCLDTQWECGREGPCFLLSPHFLRSHDLTCARGYLCHMEPCVPHISPGSPSYCFLFLFFLYAEIGCPQLQLPEEML